MYKRDIENDVETSSGKWVHQNDNSAQLAMLERLYKEAKQQILSGVQLKQQVFLQKSLAKMKKTWTLIKSWMVYGISTLSVIKNQDKVRVRQASSTNISKTSIIVLSMEAIIWNDRIREIKQLHSSNLIEEILQKEGGGWERQVIIDSQKMWMAMIKKSNRLQVKITRALFTWWILIHRKRTKNHKTKRTVIWSILVFYQKIQVLWNQENLRLLLLS